MAFDRYRAAGQRSELLEVQLMLLEGRLLLAADSDRKLLRRAVVFLQRLHVFAEQTPAAGSVAQLALGKRPFIGMILSTVVRMLCRISSPLETALAQTPGLASYVQKRHSPLKGYRSERLR